METEKIIEILNDLIIRERNKELLPMTQEENDILVKYKKLIIELVYVYENTKRRVNSKD